MQLTKDNVSVSTEDAKFKKGALKDADITYPNVNVAKNGREKVIAFLDKIDPNIVTDWIQSKFTAQLQQAWKNACGFDDDAGTATQPFDEGKFADQIISGKVRGETIGDMQEKLEELMDQLAALTDEEQSEETTKKGFALISEIKVLRENIKERSSKWEGRRNKNKEENAAQNVAAA